MFRNKRLIIAIALAALIAGIFWSQSRIPALNEKAQMGLRTNFGSIAFEIVLPVSSEQLLVERIFRTAVNWAYTNLFGMLFGLLFAAAILGVLANFSSRQFQRPWLNSVSGVFVGAPLGVCVNCATPIAFGIYTAGARLETALASLFASPTLNVIVLTMTFTLLPWEVAIAKLAGVVLLLSAVPFLVRRFAMTSSTVASNVDLVDQPSRKLPLPPAGEVPDFPGAESLAIALGSTAKQFIRNLIYLTRFALPLMLLAGILGAVVIEVLPFDRFSGVPFGAGPLLIAAVVAMLLPVPIALDVIIVTALLASGTDVGLATAILFGLGVYSVYPAAVIMRYISLRLSIAIAATVVLLAMILGFVLHIYFDVEERSEQADIEQGLSEVSQEIYRQAVDICNDVPGHLQATCFVRHIDDFDNVVESDQLCEHRPGDLSNAYCSHLLQRFYKTQAAVREGRTGRCHELPEAEARNQCSLSVLLKLAQTDHNIERCNELNDEVTVRRCRTQFLNASLLFHPDDSACRNIPANEVSDCRVNAAIYRLSDTLNFDGCDTLLPMDARDHCRYTIASTQIGRHDDASGCNRIESPELRRRCESLTLAWQAAREKNFGACETLPVASLRDTCFLRVAEGRIRSLLASRLLNDDTSPIHAEARVDAADTASPLTVDSPVVAWEDLDIESTNSSQFSLSIESTPHHSRGTARAKRFRRVAAADIGLTRSWRFRRTDFFEPFIIGKGIASGDFNNDLWPDIVLATESGIWVYKNIGGEFTIENVTQGALANENVFLVAFVDADNDGWQDIFASAYGGNNYLLMNANGSFKNTKLTQTGGSRRLALSAGFADLNNDGELDVVLGNWSSGIEKLFSAEDSANTLLIREGDTYRVRRLNDVKGETNSVLIAHADDDQTADVLIGNDRLVPDQYYFDAIVEGGEPLARKQSGVPATSMFTMSLDAADFNNDLKMDVFSTDMTFARSSRDDYCENIDDTGERAHCTAILRSYADFREGGASRCNSLTDVSERGECFVTFSVKAAKQLQDPRYCDSLPSRDAAITLLCRYLAKPTRAPESIDQNDYVTQLQRNVLLLGTDHGFEERAVSYGVASSFWSWNAKAADLDNDGWQDIYVGNGFHFGENFYEIQDNVLFRNVNGERFDELQEEWGLNDPINTPSYTYADIDLDGDIDIVATGVLAAPRIYINELDAGHSIGIVLRDEIGNSSAIGARVSVTYGDGRMQMKDIKLSGGFLSFDNPVLSFGLGEHEGPHEVLIRWPDGETSKISSRLAASKTYRITRRAVTLSGDSQNGDNE